MPPRRLIHHADELRELAELQQLPIDLVERDFVLVSIAALLVEDFPGQLCFKGGFVLRHVHGHLRLSGDADTTRTAPPKHKLEAADVRRTIERAGRTLVRVRAKDPATDSARSLDFDRIDYTTDNGGKGRVAVEVSYREAVVLEPREAMIGAPYYEPFAVPVLRPEEIVAEKLRALASAPGLPTSLISRGSWSESAPNSTKRSWPNSWRANSCLVSSRPGIIKAACFSRSTALPASTTTKCPRSPLTRLRTPPHPSS